jgi:hypothetical protein
MNMTNVLEDLVAGFIISGALLLLILAAYGLKWLFTMREDWND